MDFNGAKRSVYTGVPGWETELEQFALMRLAALVPTDGLIVEIGAEFGQSASLFAAAADRTVSITSIDLFPGDLLARHQENLAQAGFEYRTRQIVGDSADVLKEWSTFAADWGGGEIDLLFIDGDHTLDGVRRDLGWLALLKPGGYVAFHDVAQPENKQPHPLHEEVTRALKEWSSAPGWAEAWRFIEAVDSLRIYQRRTAG